MLRINSVLAIALPMVVVLAGCDIGGGKPAASPSASATATGTPAATPTPPEPPATPTEGARQRSGARSVAEETDDYLFEYAYPSAAGNIDKLGDLLDAQLEKQRRELAASAAETRQQAREDGFPYNKLSYQGAWKVVADLPEFISLSNEFSTYSGGAHGNHGMTSLVWDKLAGRAIDGVDMFTSPKALGDALGQRWCKGLDAERRKKGIQPPDDGVFPKCPKIEELTVLVGSSDRRHFDRLTLYAGPYVAGAYAEGDYSVNLKVDAAVLKAVKPEYRAAFRAR